jgi:hypothetical protein
MYVCIFACYIPTGNYQTFRRTVVRPVEKSIQEGIASHTARQQAMRLFPTIDGSGDLEKQDIHSHALDELDASHHNATPITTTVSSTGTAPKKKKATGATAEKQFKRIQHANMVKYNEILKLSAAGIDILHKLHKQVSSCSFLIVRFYLYYYVCPT